MSDLISRDSLLEAMNDPKRLIMLDGRAALVSGEWGALMRHSDVLEVVASIPRTDDLTMAHGRWLTSSDIPDTLICSVCGRRFDMYHFDQKDMPYCLCGAKMDGGASDG